MPWYSAGTVAVTNNSPTVTGTGTSFSANARVGDAFRGPDGLWYEVTNVASATVISIKPNYQGANSAAGSYAIAPMQGYVKDSADSLRGFVNLYGAKLASLGPWSTAATPADARTSLGLKSAALADIVGTVSQSGGVPTGAIIEIGFNANGEYVRFANGTQICRFGVSVNAALSVPYLGAYVSEWITWTFPAAFISRPNVTVTPRDDSALFGFVAAGGNGGGENIRLGVMTSQGAIARAANLVAVGRWF